MRYTHRVAVTAWIWQAEKFLLLKRNNPPLIWGPPVGGWSATKTRCPVCIAR